ncbi:hypothetical protein LguiA_007601 [Lonicera macranthoides]
MVSIVDGSSNDQSIIPLATRSSVKMNGESKCLQGLVNRDIGSSSNKGETPHVEKVPSRGESQKGAFLCTKQRAGGQGIKALSSSHSMPSSANELKEFHEKKLYAETSALEVCSEALSSPSSNLVDLDDSLADDCDEPVVEYGSVFFVSSVYYFLADVLSRKRDQIVLVFYVDL